MTSNEESPKSGETPLQQVQDRIAEVAPAWGVSHLLGIENVRSMLADARQRTRDSHKAQMKALGVDTPNQPDDMGGINVQGDTTNHISITAPTQGSAFTKVASKLIPLALTLALGSGAGIAGSWLLSHWNKPSAPPQQQIVLPDYQLNLEVKDQP